MVSMKGKLSWLIFIKCSILSWDRQWNSGTDLLNFIYFKASQRLSRHLEMQVCLSQTLSSALFLTSYFRTFNSVDFSHYFWLRRYHFKCLSIVQLGKKKTKPNPNSFFSFLFCCHPACWIINNALFHIVYQHGFWMMSMRAHTHTHIHNYFLCFHILWWQFFVFPNKIQSYALKKTRCSYTKQMK